VKNNVRDLVAGRRAVEREGNKVRRFVKGSDPGEGTSRSNAIVKRRRQSAAMPALEHVTDCTAAAGA